MTVEEERAERSRDRKRHAQRIVNAYHHVFHGTEGKMVIDDLNAAFGINLPAFLSTATRAGENIKFDPYYAAIRDGQRSVLLHILAKLNTSPIGDANITEGAEVLTGLSQ